MTHTEAGASLENFFPQDAVFCSNYTFTGVTFFRRGVFFFNRLLAVAAATYSAGVDGTIG